MIFATGCPPAERVPQAEIARSCGQPGSGTRGRYRCWPARLGDDLSPIAARSSCLDRTPPTTLDCWPAVRFGARRAASAAGGTSITALGNPTALQATDDPTISVTSPAHSCASAGMAKIHESRTGHALSRLHVHHSMSSRQLLRGGPPASLSAQAWMRRVNAGAEAGDGRVGRARVRQMLRHEPRTSSSCWRPRDCSTRPVLEGARLDRSELVPVRVVALGGFRTSRSATTSVVSSGLAVAPGLEFQGGRERQAMTMNAVRTGSKPARRQRGQRARRGR